MRLHPIVRRWDKFLRGYKIEDAHQAALQHPHTFHRPTNKEISQVRVGSYVKICVSQTTRSRKDFSAERFWVNVTLVMPRFIVGLVANNLIYIPSHLLAYGDVIAFQRRHIYEIQPPDQKDVIYQEHGEPASNIGGVPAPLHITKLKAKLN